MPRALRIRRSAAACVPAWFACLALLVQAAVPAGFMLDRHPKSGALRIVMCPDQGPVPMPGGAAGRHAPAAHVDHSGHAGPDEPGSGHHEAVSPCPYALAFAPLLPLSPISTGRLPAAVGERTDSHAGTVPVPGHRYSLPVRGPPSRS